MSNVLVTGATGFIGSTLVKRLAGQGHNVVAMVHDMRESFFIGDCTFVQGDIRDYAFLCRVISQYEVETVYHCAAQAIVRQCANDPITAYEINVMGTVKLLEAIRHVGGTTVKSIVISTSDKAYGHAPAPYTEDTPFRPKYTYETTKSCQDFVAQNYFHNYDLPIKIVRCSNVYGPGDPNDSRLIPNVIKKIAREESPVVYSGVANYLREFVYIDDVVDAFILVANESDNGEAYTVGGTTGGIKILKLVETISNLMKSTVPIETPEKSMLFKEIEEQCIDGTKLKALGWTPLWTLEHGLERTIEYYDS